MTFALLAASAISLFLLGAHFLRDGQGWLVALCTVLVVLLAVRRPWVPRVLQVALALGALEWLWTLAMRVQERMAENLPWLRLALILAAVALFTAASAFAPARLREWYRMGPPR